VSKVSDGQVSYESAGDPVLPRVYFIFKRSLVYGNSVELDSKHFLNDLSRSLKSGLSCIYMNTSSVSMNIHDLPYGHVRI